MLLVLAGCSALGSAPASPTVTPAPVPADPFALRAVPVDEAVVLDDDVATFAPNGTMGALLIDGTSVDLRRPAFVALQAAVRDADHVRVGDRVVEHVTFRATLVVYRLRLRPLPPDEGADAVPAADLAPGARAAVEAALARGAFNATADPLAGYYSVAHYERAVLGGAVGEHAAIAVDGQAYRPQATLYVPGAWYTAESVPDEAVDADEAVAYDDLDPVFRERFDEARASSAVTRLYGEPPLPVVAHDGGYWRFERVVAVAAFSPAVRVTATAEPVEEAAYLASLDAVAYASLDPAVREPVRRAIVEGEADVPAGPTRDAVRRLLVDARYVSVDDRFYRLCSPSVGAGC